MTLAAPGALMLVGAEKRQEERWERKADWNGGQRKGLNSNPVCQ